MNQRAAVRLLCLLLGLFAAVPTAQAADPSDAPPLVRTVRLTVRVEGDGRDARVEIPLAPSDAHQTVTNERLLTRGFTSTEIVRDGNRLAVLTYPKLQGPKRITYEFTVRAKRHAVPIEEHPVPRGELEPRPEDEAWLRPTRHLQSSSPLLREKLIKFATPRLAAGEDDAIRLAWEVTATGYVHKPNGSGNVMKATRTGHASDLGLDRLLATFLRVSGVPARPVGGLDIAKERGKRSLRWVEARTEAGWSPLSVPRGLYGELPARYVKLYHGDRPLLVTEGLKKVRFRWKVTKRQTEARR